MQVFLENHGVQYGPYSLEALQNLVNAGRVGLDWNALVEGETEWRTVNLVPGLNVLPSPRNFQHIQGFRRVGPLAVGIVLFPVVFAWFTLRKGYSSNLRLISFIWLAIFLAGGLSSLQNTNRASVASTTKQESSKSSGPAVSAEQMIEFGRFLKSVDPNGDMLVSIGPGRTSGEIKVTVANVWHYQPHQIRLQGAQDLQRAWASVYSRNQPDKAYISIVDLNGNEVGGSRFIGGTLIWVDD